MRIPLAMVSQQRKSLVLVKGDDTTACSVTSTNSSSSSTAREDSTQNLAEQMIAAPEDHGLLITLDVSDDSSDHPSDCCRMTFCPDANFRQVHPNVYAPAELGGAHSLPGGGSGAAVFGGSLPDLGNVVMKHGGYRETKELFALATISQELQKRGANAPEEAAELRQRIPEFRMMYLSPHHLREEHFSLKSFMQAFLPNDSCLRNAKKTLGPNNNNTRSRRIRISALEDEKDVSLHLHKDSFDVSLHSDDAVILDDNTCQYGVPGEGYYSLKSFVDRLQKIQKQHRWKFTLGQKTIGGSCPQTAAFLLASGKLHGDLLENLIDQFIDVIQSLQALTLPEEADVVDIVRKELGTIQSNQNLTAADISSLTDAFCGCSLKKNWHPKHGRFVRLREMGAQFRSSQISLTKEEVLPAHHLGVLLQAGSTMGDVYEGAPLEHVALDLDVHKWRSVLGHAVMGIRCRAALRRVWTCGLSDAGLHNLFLSENKLWLFDLGEPSLQALPGFLTKFLFSFFHTLGMEENDKGGWVNRFVPGDKLALAEETKALLPKAYEAFEVTLDRLSDELFFGEDGVRGLLVQYITLQLLSDTAFCLERWAVKGGGHANREKGIEKWLWRALWDVYIAFDINTKEWTCEHRCYYSAFRRTPSGTKLRKRM